MPELSFVLPHWLYWSGLLLFPLITIFIYRRATERSEVASISLPVAYFLLIVSGFIGVHRLYLKSRWALAFIAVFIAILFVNVEVRDVRNEVSNANNSIAIAEHRIKRAEKNVTKGRRGAEEKLAQAKSNLAEGEQQLAIAREHDNTWTTASTALAGTMLVMLIIDLALLPKAVRRRRDEESGEEKSEVFQCPSVEAEHDDSREPFAFSRIVSRLNGYAGEFVAYWSLLAVGVYYYEVMARYVFNSPTNWAHEAMFLMFGMQYLIAGGFVLREGAHVRVDVLYMHLPNRGKAIVDLLTSVFFFIFVITLMITGWTFFMDSFNVGEVSFTEWHIQYWPVKIALPLGAALLLLQGVALLIKDIAVVFNPEIAEIEAEVRPEG